MHNLLVVIGAWPSLPECSYNNITIRTTQKLILLTESGFTIYHLIFHYTNNKIMVMGQKYRMKITLDSVQELPVVSVKLNSTKMCLCPRYIAESAKIKCYMTMPSINVCMTIHTYIYIYVGV